MRVILLAGLPALALLAACDSQDNATTTGETPVVAGDDEAIEAPAEPTATTPPSPAEAKAAGLRLVAYWK